MKKFLFSAMMAAAVLCMAEFDASKAKLTGSTDKSALSYKRGETMVFTVKADLGGQSADGLFIRWNRQGDDGKTFSGKSPAGEPAVVKTSMDKPGFVSVNFTLVDKNGKAVIAQSAKKRKSQVAFYAGAGVEVETLTDCGEPADFDAFWAKQKARLAKVPFAGKVESKLVKSTPEGDIYAVSIPCAGPRPATGFLTVPKNAGAKSLPAVLLVSGYGSNPQRAPGSVVPRRITFALNAHGQKLLQPDGYYKKFFESIRTPKYSYAFNPEENKDPEKAFFNGMVLRVLRALEYLKSRPEWDGKNLIVQGGSQGGLQTMWAAALDQNVTVAKPSITWCCDLAGQSKKGRLHGGWRIQYDPALDYYDPVFMAKRIRTATVEITRAGLGDYTCPPSGLAISYRNLATPRKSIRWVQGSNHGFVPEKSEVIVWSSSGKK